MILSTTEGVPSGYRLVRHHWLHWTYEYPDNTDHCHRFSMQGFFTAAGAAKAAHRHLELVKEYEEVFKTR